MRNCKVCTMFSCQRQNSQEGAKKEHENAPWDICFGVCNIFDACKLFLAHDLDQLESLDQQEKNRGVSGNKF